MTYPKVTQHASGRAGIGTNEFCLEPNHCDSHRKGLVLTHHKTQTKFSSLILSRGRSLALSWPEKQKGKAKKELNST